ncbi:MAG: hypothetical protein AB8B97_23860 [Granulosicoccus sp.]
MNDDSAGSVDSLIRSVVQNVRAQLASFSSGAHLAWAEVRVVASHAGLLLGLVIVAAGLILVGWGLLLLSGVFILMSTGVSGVVALVSVSVVNMVAFLGVCLYMRHTLKVITFKHTRKALGMDGVGLSPTE